MAEPPDRPFCTAALHGNPRGRAGQPSVRPTPGTPPLWWRWKPRRPIQGRCHTSWRWYCPVRPRWPWPLSGVIN